MVNKVLLKNAWDNIWKYLNISQNKIIEKNINLIWPIVDKAMIFFSIYFKFYFYGRSTGGPDSRPIRQLLDRIPVLSA